MFSAMTLAKAGAVCGLVALSTGSVHFAWGSVAHPMSADAFEDKRSDASTMVAVLQAGADTTFVPDALVTRPLFSASRRQPVQPEPVVEPPVEAASVASSPEEPPPSYIVGGVIVSAGVRKILLRREQREAAKWLSQGEMTGEGWTIVSIKTDGAVLERGGREFAVPLRINVNAQ
jgi:hypothetical protein